MYEHHYFGTLGVWDKLQQQDQQNVGLYDKSRGGEMVEDNMAAPEVHQHGGDVNPFPTKQQQQGDKVVGLVRPFKDLGNSTWAPIARGG